MMFYFRVGAALSSSSDVGPDRLRGVDDKAELLHDVFLCDGVPVRVRSEATLGANADPAKQRESN